MVDLRQAAAELIANPLVPVPPIEGVVARARAYHAARRRRQFGASVALVALVVTAVARAGFGGIGNDSLRTVGDPARQSEMSVPSTSTTAPGLGDGATSFPTVPWSGQSFESDWRRLEGKGACRVVRPATPAFKVLLSQGTVEHAGARDGVEDLVAAVNGAGGVCGRHIELVHRSLADVELDDFVAAVGAPLDEQLDAAIAQGRVAGAGTPIVTGDGLSQVQHAARLVYPVSPSAAAMTRTAVDYALARGAKSFAIVYDAKRTFGQESAAAFDEYVRRRGVLAKASVPVDPTVQGFAVASDRLANACGLEGCDFVLLAVLAETAKQWLVTNPAKPRVHLAGLSPMLAEGLSDHCVTTPGGACDGLVAWSGFVPWSPAEWWNLEARAAYGPGERNAGALRAGAVIAARVLYEALLAAGPDATAADVRRALDRMAFSSMVTPRLSWPGGVTMSSPWVLRTDGLVPQPAPPPDRPPHDSDSFNDQSTKQVAPFVRSGPSPQWHRLGTGWRSDPG